MIDRQIVHMTRLIDDLLDVSRITRGGIELRKEFCVLQDILQNAIESSRPLIEKCSHALSITIPADPIHLLVDPTRLTQAFSNLLNNAAKYMPEGGRISLIAELRPDALSVKVQDKGIGIPADMLSRIFEMFVQVDRSLERSYGGLGIGLTLVKQLVEMHGGRVEAESPGPGCGSTFTIYLPRSLVVDGTQPAGGRKDRCYDPAERRRILIVDDNADSARSLAELLKLAGADVSVAYDGIEAVGAVAVFRPEIILLDIGLPKLNGYEVVQRIRANSDGRAITCIAVTGWGAEHDRQRAIESGFDYHMTKPVDFAALQKLLNQIAWQRQKVDSRAQ
jgi:CheY-like chemotaxis protein/anti-sigma regulatory factor (Ser/Thr protein kinase)